jgi:hypothetical protein
MVYATLQLYEIGRLTERQAIEELKVKKSFDQIAFRSARALVLLKYFGSEEVEL